MSEDTIRNTISFPKVNTKLTARDVLVGTIYKFGSGDGAYMRIFDKQVYLTTGRIYDLTDSPVELLPAVTITSPK